MIPDEVLATMLAQHTERMHTIASDGLQRSQALGAKLLECVRDPLTIRAEAIAMMRGAKPISPETPQGTSSPPPAAAAGV